MGLIKRCMQDLNRVSSQLTNENRNLVLPFDYVCRSESSTNSMSSPLASHTYSCGNLNKNSLLVKPSGSYHTSKVDFNVEANDDIDLISSYNSTIDKQTSTSSSASVAFYYYNNCVVEVLLKVFAKNIGEKFALLKYLTEDLMPTNSNLIRMFAAYSVKLYGLHQTLQSLYDHLTINSIDNQHLWVL